MPAVIPSRPELIKDLTAAIDKARTYFDSRVTVRRIDDLAASITSPAGEWEVSYHRDGKWDLFKVDERGNLSHVNVYSSAGKAVGHIASLLFDTVEDAPPAVTSTS